MSKKSDILIRLIDDTRNNKIKWKFLRSTTEIIRVEGNLYLTKKKLLAVYLSYYKSDPTFTNLKLFFIDDFRKYRTNMIEIEEGIFTFKVNNLLSNLIKMIEKKISEPIYSIGPPKLKSVWEEEDENDVVY